MHASCTRIWLWKHLLQPRIGCTIYTHATRRIFGVVRLALSRLSLMITTFALHIATIPFAGSLSLARPICMCLCDLFRYLSIVGWFSSKSQQLWAPREINAHTAVNHGYVTTNEGLKERMEKNNIHRALRFWWVNLLVLFSSRTAIEELTRITEANSSLENS